MFGSVLVLLFLWLFYYRTRLQTIDKKILFLVKGKDTTTSFVSINRGRHFNLSTETALKVVLFSFQNYICYPCTDTNPAPLLKLKI